MQKVHPPTVYQRKNSKGANFFEIKQKIISKEQAPTSNIPNRNRQRRNLFLESNKVIIPKLQIQKHSQTCKALKVSSNKWRNYKTHSDQQKDRKIQTFSKQTQKWRRERKEEESNLWNKRKLRRKTRKWKSKTRITPSPTKKRSDKANVARLKRETANSR